MNKVLSIITGLGRLLAAVTLFANIFATGTTGNVTMDDFIQLVMTKVAVGVASAILGWWGASYLLTRSYKRASEPKGPQDYNITTYLRRASWALVRWLPIWKGMRELTSREAELALKARGFAPAPTRLRAQKASYLDVTKMQDAYYRALRAFIHTLGYETALHLSQNLAQIIASAGTTPAKRAIDKSFKAEASPTTTFVQSALHARGYYQGVIDGCFNDELKTAVRLFQKDYNLSRVGRITPDLLEALETTQPLRSSQNPRQP